MLLRAGMAVCLRVPVNSTLGGTVVHVRPLAPSRAQCAYAREPQGVGRGFGQAAAPSASATSLAPLAAPCAAPATPLRLSSLSAGAPCRPAAQVRISLGTCACAARQPGSHPSSQAQSARPAFSSSARSHMAFGIVGKQSAAPCAFGLPGSTRLTVPPNITFNRTLHGMAARPPSASVHGAPVGQSVMPFRAG